MPEERPVEPAPHRLTGGRLVIASHNAGKVREIGELLAPYGVAVVAAAELGLPEPEETGATFVENAALKARAAAAGAGLPALADDSGLSVRALGGRPGIHSARWAGTPRDFGAAMERVERALAASAAPGTAPGTAPDRHAAFVCVLCLAWPDGTAGCFEGRVEGELVWPPRGTRGFGYDPIFRPAGERLTFGEMEPARKHAMSHRARAFAQLVRAAFAAER